MKRKKVLFLIHDLGQGGAEKVLVNLVNNMDLSRFEISIIALFGGGVNEQFLRPEIHYRTIFSKAFPGNSHVMKLFSSKLLHRWFVKGEYDVEISYLEGPSARIISGCESEKTKLLSWIHCSMNSPGDVEKGFRSMGEAEISYNKMDKMIFVSEGVGCAFLKNCDYTGTMQVLYNTVESEKILNMAGERAEEIISNKIGLIAVGTLKPVKGFDRLLRVVKRLKEDGYPVHLYLLGSGPQQKDLEIFIKENSLDETVSLLGYKTNPYKYVSKCDLFICSSLSEGFSTAVTEALIVGTPVCSVEVTGMKELLGNDNEFGIVTDNNEEDLYKGIKALLDNPKLLEHYKQRASERGKSFSTENTVNAVETMLLDLVKEKK